MESGDDNESLLEELITPIIDQHPENPIEHENSEDSSNDSFDSSSEDNMSTDEKSNNNRAMKKYVVSKSDSEFTSEENLYTCASGCGISFLDKHSLTNHVRNHCNLSKKLQNIRKNSFKWTRESDQDASEEEEESSSKKLRLTKNEKEVNKTGYECFKCKKILKTRQTLQNHMVIHSESRPYQCEKCDQTFKLFSSLYNHKKLHQDKKLKCDECGKAFTQSRELTRHLKVHSSKRSKKK